MWVRAFNNLMSRSDSSFGSLSSDAANVRITGVEDEEEVVMVFSIDLSAE